MAAGKVLVLESVEDNVTMERVALKRSFFSKNDVEVEYCYAVELTKRQQQLDVRTMVSEVLKEPLDGQDLLARVDQRITSFRPDVMIVHAGFVFLTHPEVFLSVLTKLKSLHPELRIGSELHRIDSRWKLRFATVLEESDEIRGLAVRLV